MYLPEGVDILICSGGNMNVLSRRGVKFVLLVNKTMHVLARREWQF